MPIVDQPSSKLVTPKILFTGNSGAKPVYIRAVSKEGVMLCRFTILIACGLGSGTSIKNWDPTGTFAFKAAKSCSANSGVSANSGPALWPVRQDLISP